MTTRTPLLLARIQISHWLDAETGEPSVMLTALDGADEPMAVLDALGLLELAKDSILHRRPHEDP